MDKPKKIRRTRKPMSPEQKEKAVARLAEAREKRLQENPPQYKNIAQSVQDLPDDHPMSMTNVKEWIQINKDKAASLKVGVRQNVKGMLAQLNSVEGYIRHMHRYLETGDWVDDFYGADAEHKMKMRSNTLAYDKDGNIKRTIGVYYPDLGVEWTRELDMENRNDSN